MKKETISAVKNLARHELPVPPPRVMKDKKQYSRKEKHKAGYRDDHRLFCIRKLSQQLMTLIFGDDRISRKPALIECSPYLIA